MKMKQIIKENLENVETGKPLTRPLVVLGDDFKKVYKEKFGDSMQMLSKTVKLNTKKLQFKKHIKKHIIKDQKLKHIIMHI